MTFLKKLHNKLNADKSGEESYLSKEDEQILHQTVKNIEHSVKSGLKGLSNTVPKYKTRKKLKR